MDESPIRLHAVERAIGPERRAWFGIAEADDGLLSCSVADDADGAIAIARHGLPAGAGYELATEPSAFALRAAELLAAIEGGEEYRGSPSVSPRLSPPAARAVYELVAAIPPGYATSYGEVARVAGTIAREVGRLMARNPLYPLVQCHRVVGADYSLTGYRGATSGPDLDDKLARLRAEARGYRAELVLPEAGGLRVFPVERVMERETREDPGQSTLF